MNTAYIRHPDCHLHDTGEDHPETASRLFAIDDKLLLSGLSDFLRTIDAPEVTQAQLLRVHSTEHLKTVKALMPQQGYVRLDPDTVICPDTMQAAKRAAGAVVSAVELVMSGKFDNAFCSIRPPGHHAERTRAMGFCIFNNLAVGVAHVIAKFDIAKVAILDFDVHQGNGTEDIFVGNDKVLYCSIFQHPFFPFTKPPENTANVISIPLDATAKSNEFRTAVSDHWLPALERFKPEIIFVSAGFDAHRDDDMSYVSLLDDDFRWVTEQIVQIAEMYASGRVISVLEGGYELNSLARCVEIHLRVLMGLN